jgi:hypothetical protein
METWVSGIASNNVDFYYIIIPLLLIRPVPSDYDNIRFDAIPATINTALQVGHQVLSVNIWQSCGRGGRLYCFQTNGRPEIRLLLCHRGDHPQQIRCLAPCGSSANE